MLTAAQLALLNGQVSGQVVISSGYTPPSGTVPAQTILLQNPGCAQNNSVGATQQSVPLDPSQFNRDQCGVFNLYVNTTATSIATTYMLTLGGSLAIPSDAALAREMYAFSSTTSFLFDLDASNIIGVNSANYSPLIFLPFFDQIVAGRNIVASGIFATELGGTVASLAAFATFKAATIQKRSTNVQSDFDIVQAKLLPALCDPCLQDDGTHAQWTGFIPLTSQDLAGIPIPPGLNAQLQFCIYEYENSRNMTVCATA